MFARIALLLLSCYSFLFAGTGAADNGSILGTITTMMSMTGFLALILVYAASVSFVWKQTRQKLLLPQITGVFVIQITAIILLMVIAATLTEHPGLGAALLAINIAGFMGSFAFFLIEGGKKESNLRKVIYAQFAAMAITVLSFASQNAVASTAFSASVFLTLTILFSGIGVFLGRPGIVVDYTPSGVALAIKR